MIDGRSLTELAGEFESRGYSPAGGYACLVPGNFRFGDLPRYFLGQEEGQWPKPGYAWLPGWDCSAAGCWPLEARIVTDAETVTWTGFAQLYRRAWDYQGFGDFIFDRAPCEHAVREAAAGVGALTRVDLMPRWCSALPASPNDSGTVDDIATGRCKHSATGTPIALLGYSHHMITGRRIPAEVTQY